MSVAIVHYHLGQGGVSRVIATASRLMTMAGIRHVILAGPSPEAPEPGLPVRLVGGLQYGGQGGDAADLLERMRAAALAALGEAPNIWHFHNHSLGKNPRLPEVVARLAAENGRLLLHIHDLAEDGRPENAANLTGCRDLYPLGPRVHYAFLNSRDRERFVSAGLPETGAHLLENPIAVRPAAASAPGPPLLLYPVRGIRRKNLGELVLLTALSPPGTRAAIARAPLNSRWSSVHDGWRRFSAEMELPVQFDVADRVAPGQSADRSFEAWLSRATHLVTTSVSEGFGMVFLEAAALGKPLLGRNLPHLARDHAARGIRAGRLYDKLLVPAEWIDRTILERRLREALDASWNAWQRPPPSCSPAAALCQDGWLDFGNLPEDLQQGVIRKLREPGMKLRPQVEIDARTRPAAEWLAEALAERQPTATPAQLAPYSPAACQEKTAAIYQLLMNAPPSPVHALDPAKILDAHLTPETFHFLTAPRAAR
jgi:hypothetical protein